MPAGYLYRWSAHRRYPVQLWNGRLGFPGLRYGNNAVDADGRPRQLMTKNANRCPVTSDCLEAAADIVALQFVSSSAPMPGSPVRISNPRPTTVIQLARLSVSRPSTAAGLIRALRSVVGRTGAS